MTSLDTIIGTLKEKDSPQIVKSTITGIKISATLTSSGWVVAIDEPAGAVLTPRHISNLWRTILSNYKMHLTTKRKKEVTNA